MATGRDENDPLLMGSSVQSPPKIEKSTTLKTAGTPIHVYITIDDRYSYIYYIHKIMYIYTHMDKRLYMIYNVACLGPSTLILRCQFELWLK